MEKEIKQVLENTVLLDCLKDLEDITTELRANKAYLNKLDEVSQVMTDSDAHLKNNSLVLCLAAKSTRFSIRYAEIPREIFEEVLIKVREHYQREIDILLNTLGEFLGTKDDKDSAKAENLLHEIKDKIVEHEASKSV